jgi:restriction system protein
MLLLTVRKSATNTKHQRDGYLPGQRMIALREWCSGAMENAPEHVLKLVRKLADYYLWGVVNMTFAQGMVMIWTTVKTLYFLCKFLWPLWVLLIVMAAGRYAFGLWERQRLAKSGIWDIDRMGGQTFEKYLEVLFGKMGYRVQRTKYVGDFGADLVVSKDGVKTVVQAKRYKKKAGVKAIQEAVASKGYYDCSSAMVVTNSFYTQPAIELARRNQVELWDRNRLVSALLSVRKSTG